MKKEKKGPGAKKAAVPSQDFLFCSDYANRWYTSKDSVVRLQPIFFSWGLHDAMPLHGMIVVPLSACDITY